MTALRPGQRLFSTASSAELIVVRPADVDLACAGAPLTDAAQNQAPASDGSANELQIGKRYEDTETGLLLMCTKAGPGPITADGREMTLLSSKPLPSSD